MYKVATILFLIVAAPAVTGAQDASLELKLFVMLGQLPLAEITISMLMHTVSPAISPSSISRMYFLFGAEINPSSTNLFD